MFVTEEVTVKTGSRAAQARFENLVQGDWLAGVSEAAHDGAVTGLRKVGPAWSRRNWSGSASLIRCITVMS